MANPIPKVGQLWSLSGGYYEITEDIDVDLVKIKWLRYNFKPIKYNKIHFEASVWKLISNSSKIWNILYG